MQSFLLFFRCSILSLLLLGTLSLADTSVSGNRYSLKPASSHGIGKQYMGREIAGVMGWHGAAWLERQERNTEERTDLLLAALKLKPGMVVADIGAGTGYLARQIAPAVIPGGKIWAVDIQPEMVRLLQENIKRSGLLHIETQLSSVDDVKLPPRSIDLAIMMDVYHELSHPYEFMTSVMKALKPKGRIVFVEFKAEDPNVPIIPLHKMSELQITREATIFNLDKEATIASLPWQHVIIFRKRD